ncbi:MAG: hypothetical protein WHS83_14075, partial [Chloroflexus sp.]
VPIPYTGKDTASSPDCPRMECGSHAAAPAALTIRRVAYRYPSWSRGAECAHPDQRVGPACMRYLRVDVWLYQVRAGTPSATVST